MMCTRFVCIAAAIAIAMFASAPGNTQARQHLFLRTYQPIVLALPDFIAGSAADAEPARTIAQTIAGDLKQSGGFALINPTALISRNVSIDGMPSFADWRDIRTERLIIGRVSRQPDARIKVEFRLWDVNAGVQLMGQQYLVSPDDLSRLGHMISEEVYERVADKKREFD